MSIDSFIEALSKMGINYKYCGCVFVFACSCSFYKIQGYNEDNFTRELLYYYFLALPIHISFTGLIYLSIRAKFREYIVKEQNYVKDKNGNIINWDKINKRFHTININCATNIATILLVSIVCCMKYISFYSDKSVKHFLLTIFLCCIVVLIILKFALRDLVIPMYINIEKNATHQSENTHHC